MVPFQQFEVNKPNKILFTLFKIFKNLVIKKF